MNVTICDFPGCEARTERLHGGVGWMNMSYGIMPNLNTPSPPIDKHFCPKCAHRVKRFLGGIHEIKDQNGQVVEVITEGKNESF
jgi:hypothetical protein